MKTKSRTARFVPQVDSPVRHLPLVDLLVDAYRAVRAGYALREAAEDRPVSRSLWEGRLMFDLRAFACVVQRIQRDVAGSVVIAEFDDLAGLQAQRVVGLEWDRSRMLQ